MIRWGGFKRLEVNLIKLFLYWEKLSASGIQEAEIFYHLGVVHSEKGDTKNAILFLKKALKLKKDFAKPDDAKQRLSELGGL